MTNLLPLILASSSPRRIDLLARFGYTFDVIDHAFNERTLRPESYPSFRSYVKALAKHKAFSVKYKQNKQIIAADTIVTYKGSIFDKPHTYKDAFLMLSNLQNNTHQVISAFCILNTSTGHYQLRSASSYVTFNPLTSQHITDYIHQYRPFDKAGGYGIQECPSYFIHSFTGSIYTIIGLPIYLLNQTIKDSHQVRLSL